MKNFPEHPSKPLNATEFYALLAFAKEDLHKYALKARIANYSLRSVNLEYIQINRIVTKLISESYIELAVIEPNGHGGAPRYVYAITEYGRIRL